MKFTHSLNIDDEGKIYKQQKAIHEATETIRVED